MIAVEKLIADYSVVDDFDYKRFLYCQHLTLEILPVNDHQSVCSVCVSVVTVCILSTHRDT